MDYYKFNSGFNVRKLIMVLVFLLIVAYGGYNARSFLFGPSIEIFSPVSEETETDENTLTIKGRVANMSFLSLNNQPIFADTAGLFSEKILLSPGLNTITVKAKDRFKNETQKVVKIYYKQDYNLYEN